MKSLDQILLRLPTVRDVVNGWRREFAEAGGANGVMTFAQFRDSAPARALQLPPDTLQSMLDAADVDGNHVLDFKARGRRGRSGGGARRAWGKPTPVHAARGGSGGPR